MTTTYTTTAAAQIAGVTTDTIRVWARMGAVKATKIARRWAIEAASLLRRITLGREIAAARTTRKDTKVKKVEFTTENMVAIGGNRWKRGDKDRVYFNDWAEMAGLELGHYNTGNISSASYQGESISNSQGHKILGSIDKVWFDAADGKVHVQYGFSESRVATQREVFEAVVNTIRHRIAAL